MLHMAWAAAGCTGDSTTVASRKDASASNPPKAPGLGRGRSPIPLEKGLASSSPGSCGRRGGAVAGLMRVRSRLLLLTRSNRSEPQAAVGPAACIAPAPRPAPLPIIGPPPSASFEAWYRWASGGGIDGIEDDEGRGRSRVRRAPPRSVGPISIAARPVWVDGWVRLLGQKQSESWHRSIEELDIGLDGQIESV